MKEPTVSILPIDEINPSVLKHLGESIKRNFGFKYHMLPVEPIAVRRPELLHQGKYNSTGVLLYISKHLPGNSIKVLVVTQLDLYSPIFSHLYGEAQLKGDVALMSLHRLHQEFYHLNPDSEVFLSRCEKEALHELGHTFGLMHCQDRNCVMYPSSTIADTDIKANRFCPLCARRLGK
jgi:archaemetzincin